MSRDDGVPENASHGIRAAADPAAPHLPAPGQVEVQRNPPADTGRIGPLPAPGQPGDPSEEVAALTAAFDHLPYPARMHALAAYARSLDDDGYRRAHAALDAGDTDARHTGLFLATVRRDLAAVEAALDDPVLRRRALAAALRLPVAERALSALALGTVSGVRHDTYRVLRLSRRRALSDRLLPEVQRRYGAAEAARLLPACSTQAVADWLPRHADAAPTAVLGALARTAPGALAAHLATHLAGAGPQEARHQRQLLRRKNRRLVTVLARRDPSAALLLVTRVPWMVTEPATAALLRDPRALLDAVRAGGVEELALAARLLSRSVRRALRGLPPAELAELAAVCTSGAGYGRSVAPEPLLLLVEPAVRERLVAARGVSRTRRPVLAPANALAALDPEVRAALVRPAIEARRRMAAVTALGALLPLAEAEPALRSYTGSHRVHERAGAWPTLIACARLNGEPAAYGRVLASCERTWHDQEMIRHAALAEAALAPARLLSAVPLGALRDAATTTVQSRDTTVRTLAAAERLLRRTASAASARADAPRAAAVALLLTAVLTDPRRTGPRAPLPLTTEAARATWTAALLPPGTPSPATAEPGPTGRPGPADTPDNADSTSQPPRAIEPPDTDGPTHPAAPGGEFAGALRGQRGQRGVALAELLGDHIGELPELEALLVRTAERSDDLELAGRAAALLLGGSASRGNRADLNDREARENRCAELLSARVELITAPAVLRTVMTRRTDLLDAVDAAGLPADWVPRPPGRRVAGRWLPRQRAAVDRRLARVAADEDVPLRERTDAAASLRDPDALLRLAARAPQPVAAAALTAIGALCPDPMTPPEAIGLLLPHAAAGGVRGRAAMATVRGLLGALPDAEAVALLAPVVRDTGAPVGTRKEAVRALADLSGESARQALTDAWDAPGQHRDVLAVLVGPLRADLGRTEVRDRLRGQLHHGAVLEAVTNGFARVPADRRGTYAGFLAGLVRTRTPDIANAACRTLEALGGPSITMAARSLGRAVADPARPDSVRRHAAGALVRGPAHETVSAALRSALGALTEQADAGSSDDPAVRRSALRALVQLAGHDLRTRAEAADAVADALESVGLRAAAARTAFGAALSALLDGGADMARWDRCLALTGDGPHRLDLAERPCLPPEALPEREFLAVVTALGDRRTRSAGLIAVVLVRAAGEHTSWSEPWPAALGPLLAHPDPDVAEAALRADLRRPVRPAAARS